MTLKKTAEVVSVDLQSRNMKKIKIRAFPVSP